MANTDLYFVFCQTCRLERERLEREKVEAERERVALEREKRQREREQIQLEREKEESKRRALEQQRYEMSAAVNCFVLVHLLSSGGTHAHFIIARIGDLLLLYFFREEQRRAAKRPHGSRDEYWDSKRPASDSHFEGGGANNFRNG